MNKVKIGHGGPNLEFTKAFESIIKDFANSNFKATQEALYETAQEGTKILSRQTPIRTGAFKEGWKVEGKYANVKFIYNDRLANNRIPLSNLFEYSRNHKPFIFQTFNQSQGELLRMFNQKMKEKL